MFNFYVHSTNVEDVFNVKLVEVVKEIKSTENIRIVASGGSCPWETIDEYSFTFAYDELTTVEEARERMIRIADKILTIINTDTKIRRYLKNYPFKYEDIDMIFLYNLKIKPQPPYLITSYFARGRMMYDETKPVEERPGPLDYGKTVLKETIAEALEKLKKG